MAPVFHYLELNADTARIGAFVLAVGLTLFIIVDGYRTRGREKLGLTALEAVGFGIVSLGAVHLFAVPDNLPEGTFYLPLRTYGLMVVIGMVSCFFVQRHFGRQVGLTGDQILTIWVYGGICAIVGARGLHVLVNWADYAADPMGAVRFWDGGLVFVGAALGSVAFSVLYLRARERPLWPSLDALILGVALTHGFGRVGCFFAGCCYGRPTDLPWGVSFPVGSIAQFTLTHLGHLEAGHPTAALHPTQLYEAAVSFAVGLALLAWYRRPARAPGTVAAAYFVAYPAARFVLELFRDDPEREFLLRWPAESPRILSTSQFLALVLVPLGLWGLRRLVRRAEAGGQAAASGASASSGR